MTIKKEFLIIIALTAIAACGCDRPGQGSIEAIKEASRAELISAIVTRDSLLLIGEEADAVADSLAAINRSYSRAKGTKDYGDIRRSLCARLDSLKSATDRRVSRLDGIRKEIDGSVTSSRQLISSAAALSRRLAGQRKEIVRTSSLIAAGRSTLSGAERTLDSLKRTVASVAVRRDSALTAASESSARLNRCMYIVGSKETLKERGVIRTRFLRSTLIMPDGFDSRAFTVADRRSLDSIYVGTGDFKVLTNHPAGSWTTPVNGTRRYLRIVDPARFWSRTNYLVIRN